jgi:hypothetical protein
MSRAAYRSANDDRRKTLAPCWFLCSRGKRNAAMKYSPEANMRAMICQRIIRVTSRARVVIANFSLGRFGVSQ